MAHAALALAAALGGEVPLAAVGIEGVQGPVGAQEDRTAPAPVTAVGPALRGELLAAEAHGAGTAVAGREAELDLVEEHAWALGEE